MARILMIFGPNRSHRRDLFFEFFSTIFRIFRKLFVNFVLSKIFPEIGGAETIRLVQKSSKSEPSS